MNLWWANPKLQRVMQICRPWDSVASLSPCHSSSPGKNMSVKLRPSGSNAINWRFCAFVAAYQGKKRAAMIHKGVFSMVGKCIKSQLERGVWQRELQNSKPAGDYDVIVCAAVSGPCLCSCFRTLLMKELMHQGIARLALDKSGLVTMTI